jgi:hypothetical protein
MPIDKLENLVRIRQLKAEPATEEEIAGLLRSGKVRLEDAKNANLSQESRFDLAYNAAHALSLAALRHAGYRNLAEYEGDIDVDDQLLEALIRVADLIANKLQK